MFYFLFFFAALLLFFCFVVTFYIGCFAIIYFVLCGGIIVANITYVSCAKIKTNRCAFGCAVVYVLCRVVIAG